MRAALVATLLLGCGQNDTCPSNLARQRLEVTITSSVAFDRLRVQWLFNGHPQTPIEYASSPTNTRFIGWESKQDSNAPSSLSVDAYLGAQLVARGGVDDLRLTEFTDDFCTRFGVYDLTLLAP